MMRRRRISLSKHIKDELSEAVVFGSALAMAWQAGLPMNLERACGGMKNRSPYWLPTYRFEKTSCWGSGAKRTQTKTESIGVQRLVTFGKCKPSAKLVVYCFAYAGGSSAVLYTWASQAPPSLEFVAIEMPERGVRANEDPKDRVPYSLELDQVVNAIQDHAKGWSIAVIGLSSGATFALNVVSVLEKTRTIEKLARRRGQLCISSPIPPCPPPRRPSPHRPTRKQVCSKY